MDDDRSNVYQQNYGLSPIKGELVPSWNNCSNAKTAINKMNDHSLQQKILTVNMAGCQLIYKFRPPSSGKACRSKKDTSLSIHSIIFLLEFQVRQ